MIVDLPDTTVSKISRALVSVREEGGAVALGRVLTLVILTREGAVEEVIEAANDASREHPMRVIVLMIPDGADGESRLDAQIRVGGVAERAERDDLSAHGVGGWLDVNGRTRKRSACALIGDDLHVPAWSRRPIGATPI